MHYDCTKIARMENIECDGRKITSRRDSPGQKSVYIPPGNPERETYRLSTFHHYPRDSPMDPRQFAACGFYYTGYKDRVKCFSCGQCSDSWLLGDDITSPEWHDLECDFMHNRDRSNIPILGFLRQQQTKCQSSSINRSTANQESSRLASTRSSALWTTNVAGGLLASTSSNSPDRLCRNDFHSNASLTAQFSSNTDINHGSTTEISTTNVSNTFNSPADQILAATPTAGEVLASLTPPKTPVTCSNLAQSVPRRLQTGQQNYGRASSPNILSSINHDNLFDMFPCLHPINPHMRTTEGRLQTFLDNASIWPAHRIRATPQQIIDAGMYYLGERDRVKCWYCNGGLQNWEQDDDPWEEHTKWFPLCEYVLQQKGPDYVHQIVAGFPELRRPTLYNPSTSPAVQTLIQNLHISSNQPNRPLTLRNGQTAPIAIVDPRQEIAERNRRVSEEMRSSDDVAQARMMGFDDDVIRSVLQKKYETTNEGFQNFLSFVETILSTSDGAESMEPREESTATSQPSISEENSALTPLQEMRKLEESRRCKRCQREDACVVFLPCGHLACCVACAEKAKRCPVCSETIRDRLRSFLA